MKFYGDFKLGVLGGGQLGRMLIQAATDLNIDIYCLDPDAAAPCSGLAKGFEVGSLTDFDTVYQWGKDKDLITIEIENVNVEALEKLQSEGKKVFPQPQVIRIIQDKRVQKQFYKEKNIPTADFILTDTKEDIQKNISFLPAFQKLGRSGYDGRGVQRLESAADLPKALEGLSLLEKKVDYEKEISVIVARNEKGEVSAFPVVELVFHPVHNLVEYLFAPASIMPAQAQKATEIAVKVIKELNMTGLLAVEMFLEKNGNVLVNEVAPRPHNSGHQSIEANYTSQYEQHLRSILDLPLGSTAQILPAAMINLLGEAGFSGPSCYEGLDEALQIEGVYVHLYGKKTTKPFRKMGHVTIADPNMDSLKQKVKKVKDLLKVKA
ncbi:MAG TPA: 5-(carboxyamino)imidazole ribonucleotide synthase [Cytophagaceae bacterium]|nr:5-(carboxyamino)imidazole ribonucleotide synthase [Cytophagaceae bacterium]